MRRSFLFVSAALFVLASASGCAKKQTATTTETGSDSLLSSNPVEQPQGNLTPQSQYPPPATQTEAPPPAHTSPETRAATSRPHTRTEHHHTATTSSGAGERAGTTVDAGTPIQISVGTQISSKTANVGDTWTGEVKDPVIVGDRVVFPAGSTVTGTVTEATPAERGGRATIGIAVTAISVNGTSHPVEASTEPIVAGSTRARNLGAMAGGAAAGALIGRAVGGSGKGALIGGLIGAAGAGAGVAASKGYQVVIKEGTIVTFTVKHPVTVRT